MIIESEKFEECQQTLRLEKSSVVDMVYFEDSLYVSFNQRFMIFKQKLKGRENQKTQEFKEVKSFDKLKNIKDIEILEFGKYIIGI